MRLILKITLLFMVISSIVILVGAVFSYNSMSREIEKEEQWFLEERVDFLVGWIERHEPKNQIMKEKMIITPLDTLLAETDPVFSDTLVTHTTLQRVEPHIKLDVIKHVKGRAYKIMLFDLIIEQDDIEDAVKDSMTKTYVLLLIVSFLLSLIASYVVFKPFQETLEVIRNFSIKNRSFNKLPTSTTSEFKKLNLFVEEMMQKAQSDYWALKEFSENASHEFQTPISVALGKLDLLLESGELQEDQLGLITSAQDSLRRLSKLSNALALLTKIENKEFSEQTKVNFSNLVKSHLNDFRELMDLKGISLAVSIEEDVMVNGNSTLLEILITNLITNAIRHNLKESGHIHVRLLPGHFSVENTGCKSTENPSRYFQRFKKGSENPDSSGLGLSIVKQICDQHGFRIDYQIQEQIHNLSVKWT